MRAWSRIEAQRSASCGVMYVTGVDRDVRVVACNAQFGSARPLPCEAGVRADVSPVFGGVYRSVVRVQLEHLYSSLSTRLRFSKARRICLPPPQPPLRKGGDIVVLTGYSFTPNVFRARKETGCKHSASHAPSLAGRDKVPLPPGEGRVRESALRQRGSNRVKCFVRAGDSKGFECASCNSKW
jgi:hypothetical protein